MKIDKILTACDANPYYYNLFPYVHKVWKQKLNYDLYLILISNEIPEILMSLSDYIILFEPIPNIKSSYVSQVIRILYPCLFDNSNILITDVDILPISHEYFNESISKFTDEKFITYTDRYVKSHMYAICYNVANSTTWKKIFNINNTEDIKNFLIENYNTEYSGKKNCPGWYSDQQILFKYVEKYKNMYSSDIVILTDTETKYNRLDGKSENKLAILKNNKKKILGEINTFSDFHIMRRWDVRVSLLEEIIQCILER